MSFEHDEQVQSNLPRWQKRIGKAGAIALSNSQGQPIPGDQGAGKRYVGRVVVELWKTDLAGDDYQQIIVSADAVDGNHSGLLRRIAAALSRRVQNGPIF